VQIAGQPVTQKVQTHFKFGHIMIAMLTEASLLLETIAFTARQIIGLTMLLRAEKTSKDVVVSLKTQRFMAIT